MDKSNSSQSAFPQITVGASVVGIGQIALGIVVIVLAALTTWLSIRILGLLLVVWGLLDLSQFLNKFNNGFSWWRFSLGILAIGTGVLLLFFPGMGAAALSLILAILFIMGGLYKILAALSDRPPNWGWVIFGGGLSIILGFFVFSQWPIESFLILGVLVGIEIILNGWSLIAVGYASRKIVHHKWVDGTPNGAHG